MENHRHLPNQCPHERRTMLGMALIGVQAAELHAFVGTGERRPWKPRMCRTFRCYLACRGAVKVLISAGQRSSTVRVRRSITGRESYRSAHRLGSQMLARGRKLLLAQLLDTCLRQGFGEDAR